MTRGEFKFNSDDDEDFFSSFMNRKVFVRKETFCTFKKGDIVLVERGSTIEAEDGHETFGFVEKDTFAIFLKEIGVAFHLVNLPSYGNVAVMAVHVKRTR